MLCGTPQLLCAFDVRSSNQFAGCRASQGIRSRQGLVVLPSLSMFYVHPGLNHGRKAEQTIRHAAKIRPHDYRMLPALPPSYRKLYSLALSLLTRPTTNPPPPPSLSHHRLMNTISIHAFPPLSSWHPPETEKTTPNLHRCTEQKKGLSGALTYIPTTAVIVNYYPRARSAWAATSTIKTRRRSRLIKIIKKKKHESRNTSSIMHSEHMMSIAGAEVASKNASRRV